MFINKWLNLGYEVLIPYEVLKFPWNARRAMIWSSLSKRKSDRECVEWLISTKAYSIWDMLHLKLMTILMIANGSANQDLLGTVYSIHVYRVGYQCDWNKSCIFLFKFYECNWITVGWSDCKNVSRSLLLVFKVQPENDQNICGYFFLVKYVKTQFHWLLPSVETGALVQENII